MNKKLHELAISKERAEELLYIIMPRTNGEYPEELWDLLLDVVSVGYVEGRKSLTK